MGAGLTNGIAAIALGLFLGTIYFNGNTVKFIEEVKKDTGFVVWFLALVVFLAVKDLLPHRIGYILFAMVAIGFLIRAGDTLFPALNKILE